MLSWTTQAIILKRTNVGEMDRVITLLTPDQGKLVSIAKGVRKMHSSQRAYLEPGNLVTAHFKATKTLPLITQSQLTRQFVNPQQQLTKVKQLFQILELSDVLFVEGMEDPYGFSQILEILEMLSAERVHTLRIQERLNQLLMHLGYQDMAETRYTSILEYAAAVCDRPLRSYAYLSMGE